MIMASNPASLSSGPHQPPASASPYPPLSGDLAAALKRVVPEMGVPFVGQVVNTRTFSGPSGSTPGLISRLQRYAAMVAPPRYKR